MNTTTNPTALARGTHELSMFTLPVHGSVIRDGGKDWTVKMSGGFMLRCGIECHPDFVSGPMDALTFACWFNSAL